MSINLKWSYGKNIDSGTVITTIFPAGEVNVRLPKSLQTNTPVRTVTVEAKIRNSDDLMSLILSKDALDEELPKSVKMYLRMSYIPYARQDRVCNYGEANSSRVMTKLINNLNFDEIYVLDPHSIVSTTFIKNLRSVTKQENVLASFKELDIKLRRNELTLVAPDLGATKKIESVAEYFDCRHYIQGVKKRDLNTGKLSGFAYYGDVKGKDLLIVDDICDGGGTFIGLAKKLLIGGANSVSLYVSHGIFSKGVDMLYDNGIDTIYTTDSFCTLTDKRLNIKRLSI